MIARAFRPRGAAYPAPLIERFAATLSVVLLLSGGGCYEPNIKDGSLACAGRGLCPDGFTCGGDNRCWRNPDGGAAAGGGTSVGSGGASVSPGGSAGSGGGGVVAGQSPESGGGGVQGGGAAGNGSPPVTGSGGAGGPVVVDPDAGVAGGGGGVDASPPPPDVVASQPPGTGVDAGPTNPVDACAGACGARLGNGAACDRNDVCDSGHCVDGVCCDGPCAGKCTACDVSGSVGKCAPVNGQQPHGNRGACGGAGACAGVCVAALSDRCTFPGGETTCQQAMCASAMFAAAGTCNGAGACSAAGAKSCGDFQCNATGTACLTACGADADCARPSAPYCSQGACLPHRQKGERCQTVGECEGGRCVDGVCCDSACQGPCESCALDGLNGTCSPVPSGQPRGNRAPCTGKDTCTGSCAGAANGQCVFPGQSVSCTCSSALLGLGACNGGGECHTLGLNGSLGGICL